MCLLPVSIFIGVWNSIWIRMDFEVEIHIQQMQILTSFITLLVLCSDSLQCSEHNMLLLWANEWWLRWFSEQLNVDWICRWKTFAVAMLMTRYAMLCGRPPFETSTLKETYHRIAAGRYTFPGHVTPAARDLIGRLLSHYPEERPSLTAILRHEFFTCGYMPTSLNVNCCYTAPKFPAFESPRYFTLY